MPEPRAVLLCVHQLLVALFSDRPSNASVGASTATIYSNASSTMHYGFYERCIGKQSSSLPSYPAPLQALSPCHRLLMPSHNVALQEATSKAPSVRLVSNSQVSSARESRQRRWYS